MYSSRTRDWTCVPCVGRQIFSHGATREYPASICDSYRFILDEAIGLVKCCPSPESLISTAAALYHHQSQISPLALLFSSVQFSRSVVSDSLRPHGLQHASLPCPSSIPRAYSNSCPSSRWCHPNISSSVGPFSSCLHLSRHQDLFQWVSSLH